VRSLNDVKPARPLELEFGYERIVAAVATAARRATAAKPVIVRCLVMGTSVPPPEDGSKGTDQRFKAEMKEAAN